MRENRIITYSLLAHINDSSSSLKDFCDIFIPLVKRVISKMCTRGINQGLINDFKCVFDDMYSLDIPYPILKKIVSKISNEVNKENLGDFILHEDGSFLIKKHSFSDYEEIVKIQEEEVELLERTYSEYLKDNGNGAADNNSIFEFLDKNRVSLSQFFADKANSIEFTKEESFTTQAEFVKNIMSDIKIYSILRKIYLGSIISTYLEADYGKAQNTNVEYIFDTNFIMSLLDFHSPESTHTCRKIVQICKLLGYKVSVLDFTIEETKALLERTAEGFVGNLAEVFDSESTYNACRRKNYAQTDIQRIAARLPNILENEFGINTIIISKTYREETQRSGIYQKRLQHRKGNPDGALHDSVAKRYVQEKRHINISHFYEANSWFVTDIKTGTPQLIKRNGYFPEVILAEYLVNILWLTHPNSAVKSKELADICLTKLVASTLSSSQPSTRLLKELDENIKKYAKDFINQEDIARVGIAIANRTITNLKELNAAGKQGKEQFIEHLSATINTIKENEKKEKENINKKLSCYEKKLQLMSENAESLTAATKENELVQNKKIIESMKLALDESKRTYDEMRKIRKVIEKLSVFRAKKNLMGYFLVNLAYLIVCIMLTLKFGWEIIDKILTFGGTTFIMINAAYFIVTGRNINISDLYSYYLDKHTNRLYKEYGFDIEEFESYENKIHFLEQQIADAKISMSYSIY